MWFNVPRDFIPRRCSRSPQTRYIFCWRQGNSTECLSAPRTVKATPSHFQLLAWRKEARLLTGLNRRQPVTILYKLGAGPCPFKFPSHHCRRPMPFTWLAWWTESNSQKGASAPRKILDGFTCFQHLIGYFSAGLKNILGTLVSGKVTKDSGLVPHPSWFKNEMESPGQLSEEEKKPTTPDAMDFPYPSSLPQKHANSSNNI